MERLKNAMNWFRLALFGAVTTMFDQIKALLSSSLSHGTVNLLSAFVIIFVFQIVASLADLSVGYMSWLRRLILGYEFIEGDWIHEVRDALGNPVSIGFVRIDYHKGSLLVSGDAYTKSKFLLNFTSEICSYDNYILSFTYSQFGRMESKGGFELGLNGFGKYRFTPRKKGPLVCDGFFFDGSSKQVFQLTGERIEGGIDVSDRQEEARKRLSRMDSFPSS
jgi:hypothetical protein